MRGRSPGSEQILDALRPVLLWLHDPGAHMPDRSDLAAAVRFTARALAARAPGSNVELRIPPFVAVQCIEGPRHTRGTPPNIAETDPRTWLQLAAGVRGVDSAVAAGELRLSGARSGEIAGWLPLVTLKDPPQR